MEKCQGHVVGCDFAAKQIAAHILLFADPACLGALLDKIGREEAGPDS